MFFDNTIWLCLCCCGPVCPAGFWWACTRYGCSIKLVTLLNASLLAVRTSCRSRLFVRHCLRHISAHAKVSGRISFHCCWHVNSRQSAQGLRPHNFGWSISSSVFHFLWSSETLWNIEPILTVGHAVHQDICSSRTMFVILETVSGSAAKCFGKYFWWFWLIVTDSHCRVYIFVQTKQDPDRSLNQHHTLAFLGSCDHCVCTFGADTFEY